jgi:hypothetical protein
VLLSNLCIDEDRAESFLGETINRCFGLGIRSQDIASHLEDLVSFAAAADSSKNFGIGMDEMVGNDGDGGKVKDSESISSGVSHKVPSILQIAKYLEKAKEENKKAGLKNEQLKGETESLEAKNASIKQETAELLKKHDMTVEKLDWCLELKRRLLVSGHSENDYELLLNAINLVENYGHNLLAIAAQFSHHKQLKSYNRRLQVQNAKLERDARQFEERVKLSEQTIESKSQMQWQLVRLEAAGFGLTQLTWLYNVIKEIAEANGFSETDGYAVKIFQDQVQRNYNPLLGFEKRIEDLKEDFNNLQIQYLRQTNINAAQPYVGSSLTHLLRRGLQEDEIVKLTNLLEMHPEVIQSYLQDSREGKEEAADNTNTPSGPSVDNIAFSDKERDVQSFSQSLQEQQSGGPTKMQANPPGTNATAEVGAAPRQGVSTHSDDSSQPLSTGTGTLEVNLQNLYQRNPALFSATTFYGKKISLPKSFQFGSGPSGGTQQFSRKTSEETTS